MAAGPGEFQRELVRSRAAHRCEYCRLPQEFSDLSFHIEHIVSRQHGGSNKPDNLALACPTCNFHKGPNLTGIDPTTSRVEPLFHPRRDSWSEHFACNDARIVGKTPAGRTTAALLEINDAERLRLRLLLTDIDVLD